jgi:hypothetical protein
MSRPKTSETFLDMSVSPPKRIVYGFKTDVLQQQLRVQCSLLRQRPLRGGFRSIYCLTTSFFFHAARFFSDVRVVVCDLCSVTGGKTGLRIA